MVSNAQEWFMDNNGYIGNDKNDNTNNTVDEEWKAGKMWEGQCYA
jgi:hypothetical protein